MLFIFSLSACGGLGGIVTKGSAEEAPTISIIASTEKLSEGQQAKIYVILSKASKTDTSIQWSVVQSENGSSATTVELAETSGVIVIPAGELQKIFYVTSLPASLSVDEKPFRLEISGAGVSNKVEYPFKIVKNLGTAAVSITNILNDGVVNKSNQFAFTLSGVCSQAGNDVTITVSSVNVTEVCSSFLSWATTLDLSGVSDGLSALIVTHGSGEIPASANRALTKDTVAPGIAIVSPDNTIQISADNAAGFSVSGTCSENSRNIMLEAVSDSGAGEVTGAALCISGTWSIILNLEFLANGEVTITAKHIDAAGNSRTDAKAYNKDATVPVFTITAPIANYVYNSTTYKTAFVGGACSKAGAAITLSGAVNGTSTCDGASWGISDLEINGDDGSKTISANILDSAGNASSISVAVKKYTAKPIAALINAPAGTNNHVNLNAIVQMPFVLNGQYKYKVGDFTTDCSDPADYSVAQSVAAYLTGVIGTDGQKRLCLVGIDDYGNQQDYINATVAEWTKKTTAPTVILTTHTAGAYVNIANQNSFVIGGDCSEKGRSVSIGGSVPVQQVDCDNNGHWSASLSFSSSADGIVGVFISQTDIAGNTGQDAKYFTKDTIAPSITLNTATTVWINRDNRSGFQVVGDCSDYSDSDNIEITGGDNAVNVKCGGAVGYSASLTFTGASNGGADGISANTRVVTVKIIDIAGNVSQTSKAYNIQTTEPSISIATPNAASYVNDTSKAAISVSGACSDDGTDNISLSASDGVVTVTKTVDCAGGFTTGSSHKMDMSALGDGGITLSATITDMAGNTKSDAININKKVTYPIVDWTTPVAGVCIGPGNKGSYSISGTCGTETGDTSVTVSSAVLAGPVIMPCVSGVFSGNLSINDTGLTNGAAVSITVSQADIAGNTQLASRSFKYLSSGQTPVITFAGWEDVYAVGVKTSYFSFDTSPSEPGIVRFKWKEWSSVGNTCQPESVDIYRAATVNGSLAGSKITTTAIASNIREFTDETLAGATVGTINSPTDFNKSWYYGLKVKIAGNTYDVTPERGGQELRIIAPPANMALVHRWIANQEMCSVMN